MKSSIKLSGGKKEIFKYAFVQLFSKTLVLLSTYIIALKATNEVFGYVSLLQASLVTVLTLFGFNLQSGFIRYYYNNHLYKIIDIVKPLIFLLFSLSCSVSLIVLIVFFNHKVLVWFSLLPIIGFLHGMLLVFSMLSRGNGRFKLYFVSEIIRPFFLFIVSIAFYFYDFNVIFVYVLAVLGALILSIFYCFRNTELLINYDYLSKNSESLNISKFIKYTAPLFFVQVMSLINNVSDKYIMSFYLTISDIGMYGKAYLIGSSVGLFFDSLMLLWTPYVIKNRDGYIKKNINKLIFFSVIICFSSLALFLLAFIFPYPSMLLIYLDKELIIIGLIVLSAFIARSGYQVVSPILSAYDFTANIAKVSFVSMLLGFVLNFIMIPVIGILGAAIATFISFLSYSVFSILLLVKLKPLLK